MDSFGNKDQLFPDVDGEDISIQMKLHNISQKTLEESLERIKDWFKMQAHLCHIEIDEWVIVKLLSNMDFSVETTKTRIENYYTARTEYPEIFANRNEETERVLRFTETMHYASVPKKTSDDYRIMFFGFNNDDPETLDLYSFMKISFMIADIGMKEDSQTGHHFVLDCKNLTVTHCFKLTNNVKALTYLLQNCYAQKIRKIHILNAPTWAQQLISFAKTMLPEKLFQRLYLYKNSDELTEYLTPEFMPKDLGGMQPSRAELYERWRSSIRSPEWQQWFRESENKKADLSKRPKSNLNGNEEYMGTGIQGTFRSLNID